MKLTKIQLQNIIKAEVRKQLKTTARSVLVDPYKINLISETINLAITAKKPLKAPVIDAGGGYKFKPGYKADGFMFATQYNIDLSFNNSGSFEYNASNKVIKDADELSTYVSYLYNLRNKVSDAVNLYIDFLEETYPTEYEQAKEISRNK